MSGLVVKAAVLFAWTRALAARSAGVPGRMRIGLLLGLPSTTAVALVACGHERGAGAGGRHGRRRPARPGRGGGAAGGLRPRGRGAAGGTPGR